MSGETDAYVDITRLQASYADVVTRRAWDELDSLFLPGAPIRIDTVTRPVVSLSGADELGSFISEALERFEFFEFVILNTVIDVHDQSRASGRVWMVEVRQEHGSGAWSNAFGLYQDDYAIHDGRWRFAERRYQSLARRIGIERAEVFALPDWPND